MILVTGLLMGLAACGGSEEQMSEAAIANAAVKLEQKADANVNRAIAEIEAESAASTQPEPATEDVSNQTGSSGNKAAP